MTFPTVAYIVCATQNLERPEFGEALMFRKYIFKINKKEKKRLVSTMNEYNGPDSEESQTVHIDLPSTKSALMPSNAFVMLIKEKSTCKSNEMLKS